MRRFALLFDLDGTLIDSREDLAAAVNRMRARRGLAALPTATVVGFVGDGIGRLVDRALGDDPSDRAAAVADMRRDYGEHLLERTRLYPGVREGLERLKAGGFRLGVVTNKPEPAAREILRGLEIAAYFDGVAGGGDVALKPSPEGCLRLLEQCGAAPRDAVMAGDHWTDLAAGRAAGTGRVWVRWGFGDPRDEEYDFVAEDFAALADFAERRRACAVRRA